MFEKILSLFRAKDTASIEPGNTQLPPAHGGADSSAATSAEDLKNKGDSLLTSGKLLEAVQSYEAAITQNPGYGDAYINLSIALRLQKRFDAALNQLEQARRLAPDDAYIHYNLGILSKEQGHNPAAILHLEKAIQINPAMEDAWLDLILCHQAQRNLQATQEILQKAVVQFPSGGEFHLMLGNLYKQLNQPDLALASYSRAAALMPARAEAHGNLALLLQKQGNYRAAEASYRQLVKLEPARYEAHYNLGNVLNQLGKPEEALSAYQNALRINPDYAVAYHNQGNVLRDLGRIPEAEASFRKAIASQSGSFAGAYVGLGDILRETGRMKEALESYRAAIKTDPAYLDAHCSLLFNLSFGGLCTSDEYKAEVDAYGAKLAAQVTPYTHWNTRADVDRPLRVGLVSGDFGSHPVGYFLENVLRHISPAKIDLVAYSSKERQDELAKRLKQYFSTWRDIEAVSNQLASGLVHDDGIDILIDLAGHTAMNRLPMFAWKPAPVQLSWLGYFGSTGVPGMDYVLADNISVPDQHAEYFTEKVWYLPETRLCFTPPVLAKEAGNAAPPLAAEKNGFITFGCFQNANKINDFTLALWARVFQMIPDARLRFQCRQFESASARMEMLSRLSQHGIDAARVDLHGPSSREAYLAAHSEVDIILDTYPYAGGTTTCEALWMGVPTMTLAGHTMSSRQGASLLGYAGLNAWIAHDEDNYVKLAVGHAGDISGLSRLRSGLRNQLAESSLFDGARFASNLESELQKMWQAYIAKL